MEQDRPVGPVGRPIRRRSFVKLFLGVPVVSTLALAVTPVIGFLTPPRTTGTVAGGRLLVGTTGDIGPGKSKVVALGSKPVIVLNSPKGMKAFSAVCTHLGCIVGYDAAQSPDIVSPCHGGHFSATNGTVISGPPPTPLQEYPVAVEKDKIYVQDA
jgi:Rieske Fe-S protein